MSSRAERIARIIEQRKPLVIKIETVESNLSVLNTALGKLAEQCNQLLSHSFDTGIRKLLKDRLSLLQLKIGNALEALDKLKNRFNRETINIGVIGRARQGKSRLLRSLTGLTEEVIPDGKEGFCTGVRSKIYHQSGLNEAYAQVEFYSVNDFLDEVIGPYYEKLSLGAKPGFLDELRRDSVPKLPEDKRDTSSRTIYGHFCKTYSENFDAYRHLIEQNSSLNIKKDQIRMYVTQDNIGIDKQPIVNYLAVKEVQIFCDFPNNNVGKIALVDLPGLGDMNFVDEERLTKTLKQEVDFVLFVRMPSALGDDWYDFDIDLYERARKSLDILPIRLWSFMVLNWVKVSGDNDNRERCESLANTLDNKNIEVASCVIVDCSDEAEAQTLVLDQVLDYLADHIAALDQQYASSCQKQLEQLQKEISDELERANQIVKQNDENIRFEDRFPEIWVNLTTGLEKLLRELKAKRNQEDPTFKEEIKEVIQRCRNEATTPSVQSIEKRRDLSDAYKVAYLQYISELRAELSKYFLLLDGQLQQLMKEVKSQIAKVLVEDGRLGGLTKSRGAELLEAIANRLLDQQSNGKPSELKLGFHTLSSFNVSYSGIIQRKIREHLDKLDPDANDVFPNLSSANPSTAESPTNSFPNSDPTPPHTPAPPNQNSVPFNERVIAPSKTLSAQQVEEALITLRDKTIDECEQALSGMLTEPNEIAYSMAREFVDRVLRAAGVEIEWRKFLYRERIYIWEEFRRIADQSYNQQQWYKLVEEAKLVNRPQLLKFLEL